MRVYEIAKQQKLTSKEVVDILKKGGFDKYAPISVLKEDAIDYLNKFFSSQKKESKPVSSKLKDEKKEVKVAQKVKKDIPKEEVVEKSLSGEKLAVKDETAEQQDSSQVSIKGEMHLFEVAALMEKNVGEVILDLIKKGMVCNRNKVLSVDTIALLAKDYGLSLSVVKKEEKYKDIIKEGGELRWPIVVVMGHVDHGKTTLLDFVRKTRVVAKEKGGITQHIGAYEVNSDHGKIVFLDTPGHAAFSNMRSRGAKVTDIVILVVAADDGIMPQTVEVIKCAKAVKVPVIVAINKIDKIPSSDRTVVLEDIKRQLAQQDLMPEDWGGDVICVPVSAQTGEGVNELLEMVVLQAELMELKAHPSRPAKAFILESNMEIGHGPVATVICLEGSIKKGDYFVCGKSSGRVRLLVDSSGERVEKIGPAVPVKIIGFDSLPSSGDWFEVVSAEVYQKEKQMGLKRPQTYFSGFELGVEGNIVNIILKSDTFGTSEAVVDSIKQLSNKYKDEALGFKIINSGIGDISESDVTFASGSSALILGMNVKAEKNAALLAKDLNVNISLHQIIYKLIEFLDILLEKKKEPKIIEKKIGEGLVLKIFDIKGKGVVAGGVVKEGIFSKEGKVTCIRGGKAIGGGKIASLQKAKKVAKEIHKGSEFAFFCDSFQDWQVDDIVECSLETKENKS